MLWCTSRREVAEQICAGARWLPGEAGSGSGDGFARGGTMAPPATNHEAQDGAIQS